MGSTSTSESNSRMESCSHGSTRNLLEDAIKRSAWLIGVPRPRVPALQGYRSRALAIACLILHYKSLDERDDLTKLLAAGTFVGYSVILVALFCGYMMSELISKKLDVFFSLIGCAMFIASGVLILKEWENAWSTDTKKLAISKGSLAVTNGVLFFFDAIFTLRN
uniref:MARVEL domain-containing protein n=1 Tax=Anopheles culicifacies TaxID=139723 RepID=A0A182LZ15_9DIPT